MSSLTSSGFEEKVEGDAPEGVRDRVKNTSLNLISEPCGISCGVYSDVVAVGTMTGTIEILSLDGLPRQHIFTMDKAKDCFQNGCICDLEFTQNSKNHIIACATVGNCLVMFDVDDAGKEIRRFSFVNIIEPEEIRITAMRVIDENFVAAADSQGSVHTWDIRAKGKLSSFVVSPFPAEHNELKKPPIGCNQILADAEANTIFLALENGVLGTINLRNHRISRSEPNESGSAYTVLGTYRHQTKLGVGDDDGVVHLYDWGKYGFHSDFYKTHESAIAGMVPVTEHIGILGYNDGSIRAFNFFPHKPLGVVGKTKGNVCGMDISRDGRTLVSISENPENMVNFWDIGYFEDLDHKAYKTSKSSRNTNLPSSNQQNSTTFFSGL